MGKLFKFIFIIAIFGFVGLAVYAYIGPFFGADFSAPQTEIRQPIVLYAD